MEILGAALTNTDKSNATTKEYLRNIERVDPAYPYRVHEIIRERIVNACAKQKICGDVVPSHDVLKKVKQTLVKELQSVLRSIKLSGDDVEKRARNVYETGFLRRRRRSSSFETGVVWTLQDKRRPRLPSVEEINDCVDRYCDSAGAVEPPPLEYKRDLVHAERFNDLVETLCSTSTGGKSQNHNKFLFELFLEATKSSPIQAAVILCSTLVHTLESAAYQKRRRRRRMHIARTCCEMLKRSSLVRGV